MLDKIKKTKDSSEVSKETKEPSKEKREHIGHPAWEEVEHLLGGRYEFDPEGYPYAEGTTLKDYL